MKKTDEKEEQDQSINSNPSSPEQDKLDAVRELLFGQNVKEYRDDIQDVRDFIQKNQEKTDQKIDSTKEDILQKLDALDQKLDETKKDLQNQIGSLSNSKVDRSSLANLLKELANQLEK